MNINPKERRLAENEVVFRQLNEQLKKGIDEHNKIAIEDDQPEFLIGVSADDPPLYFYCECSDENCTTRVEVSLDDYRSIHEKRDDFIVVPGHEVNEVEEVIRKEPKFYVVKKFFTPPENVGELHTTEVENVSPDEL